jgi:hypothetical protein
MREHQIVITLKPEQFLQVQKLARSAGAKSMGMFVRQQLLAALGIEGQQAEGLAQATAPAEQRDLEPVVGELKRLHGELREFVAEALSAYSNDYGASVESASISIEVEEDEGLPYINESAAPASQPQYSIANDELENTAERTFAISPRLGSLAPANPTMPAYRASPDDFGAPRPKENIPNYAAFLRQQAAQENVHSGASELVQPKYEEPVEPKLVEPFVPAVEPQAAPVQNQASNNSVDQTQSGQFVQQSLTEGTNNFRAHVSKINAESPLIESDASKRDPLSELLGPADIAAREKAAMQHNPDLDDSYDVPLSILARRQQLAGQVRALSGASNSDQNERKSEEVDDKSLRAEPPAKPVSPDKSALNDDRNSQNSSAQKSEEKPKTQPAQAETGYFANYRPLENPDEDAPFSGGPPPKKRQ